MVVSAARQLSQDHAAALAWLFSRTRAGAPRGDERARRLLGAMGLAAPRQTAVVVGTNGKGSVTTMMARGLSAAGRRTGRFLSPHVEEFGERVAVDGVPLDPAAVIRFVQAAKRLSDEWPFGEETRPAFFDWTLALALTEFERTGVESCVLEAGVGGLDDATHATQPVALTVLTNVDLDHMEVLGPTLELIARSKAGAFREGVPVVCGATQPGVVAIAAEVAESLGAPFYLDPFTQPDLPDAPLGSSPTGLFALPAEIELALRAGASQGVAKRHANRRANARLAAAALRLLGVDEAAVAAGLRAPALPGRLERFRVAGPHGRDVMVVLDGAHDPAAAARLALEVQPGYVLLFGALARKQGALVLERLLVGAAAVLVTEAAPGEGAAWAPAGSTFVADTAAALDAAIATAAEQGGTAGTQGGDGAQQGGDDAATVLVAGSLYLAGLVRPLLRARGTRLADPWELAPGQAPAGQAPAG